jgi:hypothetical protein
LLALGWMVATALEIVREGRSPAAPGRPRS